MGKIVRRRVTGPAGEAWRLLFDLMATQRAQLPAVAAEFALSPAQCHVLRLLEPGRPVPMRELAEALACHASNVTGLVDRLEQRGLVTRAPVAHDRRVKALVVTARGATLRARVLDRLAEPPEPIHRLGAADLRRLCGILRKASGPCRR